MDPKILYRQYLPGPGGDWAKGKLSLTHNLIFNVYAMGPLASQIWHQLMVHVRANSTITIMGNADRARSRRSRPGLQDLVSDWRIATFFVIRGPWRE